MNQPTPPRGYKGECWVFHVNDFTPDASKDLYLTFALASSQTGPMYFDIEWGEEENGPLSAYSRSARSSRPTGTRATSCSSSSSNSPTR